MKTRYLPISLLLATLMIPSCEKTGAPASASEIVFAEPLQTKATDAASTSSVFEVRDWLNGTSMHLSNTLRYASGAWGYGTNAQYNWDNGTHILFGWLNSDGTYVTDNWFGGSYNLNGTTLTLPAKTLNNSVRQYDFLYSDVVRRNTYDNDYSEVPLVFNHIFAQVAISFKVSPLTTGNITIKNVYLRNTLTNKKAASIDFSTEGTPTVTYTTSEVDGYFATPVDFNISNYDSSSEPIDVLAQAQSPSTAYYYFWPQTEDELKDAIEVVYRVSGESADRTSLMSFPKGTSWEAGNKYRYTISYMGGFLKIEETVLPWTYEESAGTSVEDQSAMGKFLGWDANTCTVSGQNVTFVEDGSGDLKTIHGIFRINAPTPCTFHINLSQNQSYYTITTPTWTIGDNTGDITPGADIDFYITANARPGVGESDIESDLSFSVTTSSGRDISIDSELQRDGAYKIIIPAL